MTMLPLDFHPLHFCGQIRPDLGEDNWCYGFAGDSAMIGIFDGCGGSGARTHAAYKSKSEAYMASRLASGAFYECFQKGIFENGNPEEAARWAEAYIAQRIRDNVPPKEAGAISIKGMRTLPTTMAAVLIRAGAQDEILVTPVWAGDSRVYLLDGSGLSQLSMDDSNQPDPMEGQYDDGLLTNLFCADNPVKLNCRTYRIKPPFMVLAATDGCYGYVSTPMELEGMILHTMLETSSVAQWEENLQNLIASFAGDDHTLCLMSFGYSSFENIQRMFSARYTHLREKYLEKVWTTPWEDRDTRRSLWRDYRKNYMKYLEGDG
ncbi:MAG: protein phosphatase 2C domain-containing protein [Oscillospiraceae bacterium]|nr:protein phosphatase 2C domain-containing protein [Oscillospiraceae bacterium]